MDAFQEQEMSDKIMQQQSVQSAMFPVKKRAYNESDSVQSNVQRFDLEARLPQRELNRNLQLGQQLSLEMSQEKDNSKGYLHQNVADAKELEAFGNVLANTSQEQVWLIYIFLPHAVC